MSAVTSPYGPSKFFIHASFAPSADTYLNGILFLNFETNWNEYYSPTKNEQFHIDHIGSNLIYTSTDCKKS